MIKFNNVDFTYQNAQNGAGVHILIMRIIVIRDAIFTN